MFDLEEEVLPDLQQVIREFEKKFTEASGRNTKIIIFHYKPGELCAAEETIILQVKLAVCDLYNLPLEELENEVRTEKAAEARFLCYRFIKDHFPRYSQKKIGKEFNGRDHSSISYGLHQANVLLWTNKNFKSNYENLTQNFKPI